MPVVKHTPIEDEYIPGSEPLTGETATIDSGGLDVRGGDLTETVSIAFAEEDLPTIALGVLDGQRTEKSVTLAAGYALAYSEEYLLNEAYIVLKAIEIKREREAKAAA